MQADRIEAENQLSTLSDRCHDREEMVRRAQRAATEIQMRAETVETELRKTVQQTSTELQRRIAQLEVTSLPHRITPVTVIYRLHFALLHRPLTLPYSRPHQLLVSSASFMGTRACGCGVQVELAEEKSVRKAGEYQSRQTVEDLTTDVEVGLSEHSPP